MVVGIANDCSCFFRLAFSALLSSRTRPFFSVSEAAITED